MPPHKIVSGGQTGVDRGALDAAIDLGIDHGGWCPLGRRAEDGRIPDRYRLTETADEDYPARTQRNVGDADATLILSRGVPVGGTGLTQRCAVEQGKPCLVVDLDGPYSIDAIRAWCEHHRVGVLNVAGPRESQAPGIGQQAQKLVAQLLAGE